MGVHLAVVFVAAASLAVIAVNGNCLQFSDSYVTKPGVDFSSYELNEWILPGNTVDVALTTCQNFCSQYCACAGFIFTGNLRNSSCFFKYGIARENTWETTNIKSLYVRNSAPLLSPPPPRLPSLPPSPPARQSCPGYFDTYVLFPNKTCETSTISVLVFSDTDEAGSTKICQEACNQLCGCLGFLRYFTSPDSSYTCFLHYFLGSSIPSKGVNLYVRNAQL